YQAGNLRREKFVGNIHAELKSFGKTRLLNIEILLREVQFFGKWNLLPIGIVHYPPQEIAQAHDHAHGCVISFFPDQSGDGIERVEQEMRLDLSAQRAELRLRELLVEMRRLGLLQSHLFPRIKHVID